MSFRTMDVNRQAADFLLAAMLIPVIVATEYIARHFVASWLPTIGAWRVNDMLVSGAGYVTLVWLTAPEQRRGLGAIAQNLRQIRVFLHDRRVQVGASLALGAGWLAYLDSFLWGHIKLPYLVNPWQSKTVLLEPLGLLLSVVTLLLVNGVVVPLAEEWLWRGLVQPRLVAAAGYVPGLLGTSLLFSLKHAIIDAWFGRLIALTFFGLVMGMLARRYGWRAAAMAHAMASILGTSVALILNGGQL